MNDLIYKHEAIDAVVNKCTDIYVGNLPAMADKKEVCSVLQELSPVTPKRKTGKWIEHSFSEDGKARLIECSECGAAYIVNCLCDYSIFLEERRYCNKCGAKMDGFRLTFVEEQNCEGHVACSVVYSDVMEGALLELPSAQPEWNNHTVACLLTELFDDPCACNYNGIDEWLPSKCEVIDSCPNPVGVACWEQYLKHRAERRTDG